MRGFLTPDSTPDGMVCFRIYCPNHEGMLWVLQGQLTELQNSYKWENVFGAVTPEQAADLWADANEKTLPLESVCMFVGAVFHTARTSAPDGTLVCDGSQYAVADYPVLFAAIGYKYGGSGDYFNVPDLVDRFLFGTDNSGNVGDAGGEATHTMTIDEMPAHTHTMQMQVSASNVISNVPYWKNPGYDAVQTGSTGGDQPHNNMPPYVKLIPVIVAV